jgi:DNA-binding CsgD family transcriptional regulator
VLVAGGLTSSSSRLRMSEMTIKTYISRILAKLDCANRVQAVLLVRDLGPGGLR